MKTIFSLLFLALSFNIKAQDCYNSGIASPQYENTLANETITPAQENSLILMPYVMKEKEVLQIMLEKNNIEINAYVKKSRTEKNLQYLGFLGIPSGFIGAACIVSVSMFGPPTNKADIRQQNIGAALIALAPVCLGTSIYFKTQCKKNYKKAIAKYNQLYN